jgi:hypothetical protein
MKKTIFLLFLILYAFSNLLSQPVTKQEFLDYAKTIADNAWNKHDEMVANWKKSIDINYVFGYNPPGNDMYIAAIYAHLYEKTGEKEYFKRAKELLVKYGDYKKAYPAEYFKTKKEYANGLPALPNIFLGPTYCRAYILIKNDKDWKKEEKQIVEKNISESADFITTFQEWGPMNRAMLRAEFLASCVKALPDHPRKKFWEMITHSIGDDNFGKWEIEDASSYHPIWLYSLLNYGEFINDESYLKSPVMNYYINYFKELFAPDYSIPEFGDGYHNSGWDRYIPFFVKGAAILKDPEVAWVAQQMIKKNISSDKSKVSPSMGLFLLDCARWMDESLKPVQPKSKSTEVLDDMVGKKIVFRDGWNENSNYLLLNYRDEGDGGFLFRENLRNTIPVEEEKMHHGHSDENSICLLMSNGSVLLRDGGYRDFMPSGPYGAYRQDYFHNKVCIRKNKIFKGQNEGEYRYANGWKPVVGQKMLEFFRNSGAYRMTNTKKIDFISQSEFDYSRTRVTDPKLNYQQDRVIVWIKELNIYVIFDVMKALDEDYYSAANLWHTRKILNQGENWYDTEYDTLRNIPQNTNSNLVIYFPFKDQKMNGVEDENRNWQAEKVIYQMDSRHCNLTDLITFTTILIPHKKGTDCSEIMKSIKPVVLSNLDKTTGLKIEINKKVYYIGIKTELDMDLVRDWRRPKYTYESGKVKFDDFETDGQFLYAKTESNKLDYFITNCVKATFKSNILFDQQPTNSGLAFDGSPDAPGVFKVRYWKDSIILK